MSPFIKILGASVLSVGIISLLLLTEEQFPEHKNNFTRNFQGQPYKHSKTFKLPHESFYFSGVSKSRIYLGDKFHPDQILELDHNLVLKRHLVANFDTILSFKRPRLLVDSPNVYLMDGATSIAKQGKLDNLRLYNVKNLDGLLFTNISPISTSSFVLRTYDPILEQYVLVKKKGDSLVHNTQTNLLKKQTEGIFGTEGLLHYEEGTFSLIYVFRYRNEFIAMDTNLNLHYRGRTIDTVSHSQIKTVTYNKGRTTALVSPPLVVNNNSCISGDLLFIQSALLADNEAKEINDKNTVIDVYSLVDRTYQYSFYIPDFNNEKVSEVSVHGKMLFAVFETYLLAFDLKDKTQWQKEL